MDPQILDWFSEVRKAEGFFLVNGHWNHGVVKFKKLRKVRNKSIKKNKQNPLFREVAGSILCGSEQQRRDDLCSRQTTSNIEPDNFIVQEIQQEWLDC